MDSNSNKPKWEIRLPQLLNSTVGPDRQVILRDSLSHHQFILHLFKRRDPSRRHTAQVLLDQQQQLSAFTPAQKEVKFIFSLETRFSPSIFFFSRIHFLNH